ncbi:hypothetical protein [Dactylosporangium sp. NPDC049140]|uniref:hypothetical protein n=1 Tax=Dactylosporangium sp. NPDC049140 TaxID=3155647 RepID=UPI00340F4407
MLVVADRDSISFASRTSCQSWRLARSSTGPPWPEVEVDLRVLWQDGGPNRQRGRQADKNVVVPRRATSWAPHGGIWVIGLIGKPVLYVLAITVGTVISAVCIIVLKSLRHSAERRVPDTRQGRSGAGGPGLPEPQA